MSTVNNTLYNALIRGDPVAVKAFLDTTREPEPINTRYEDLQLMTALHLTCQYGHTALVMLLLTLPGIDVNVTDEFMFTPLMFGCYRDHPEVTKILLQHQVHRPDVNCLDHQDRSALFWAMRRSPESLLWLISTSESTGLVLGTELESADEITSPLVREFGQDPTKARLAARKALGLEDRRAATLFAVIVLVCDGFLHVKSSFQGSSPPTDKEERGDPTPLARFLAMMAYLPMELQMVVCHRVYQSGKNNISSVHFEESLLSLNFGVSQ